jgi:type II secretory pathway predicted ATPase ExeA
MDDPEVDADRSSSLEIAPEHVVLSEGQDHALAQLMAGMDDGARWLLVLGPEGIGKSTVLRRLLAEVERTDADIAVCDEGEAALGADGLLAVLRSRLHLPRRPAPRSLLGSRALEDVLANQRARQKPLAVLVDDAHLLPRPSLALLAELAAKPAGMDPAVFVVLAGRPALEQPALRAWSETHGDRNVVTCRVKPFTAVEAHRYVEGRIRSAAGALELSNLAIQRIVDHTGGAPGLGNALCDQAIAHPASRLGDHVSADTVDEAALHLGLQASSARAAWGPVGAEPVEAQGDEQPWDRPSGGGWRRAGWLTGAALLAGLLIYLGPGLLGSARDWLAAGPEALRSAPGPEGPGPSRAAGGRRDGVPRSVPPGREAPRAATPGRQGAEQRVATAPRATRTPPAVAAAPSPEQVASLLAGARAGPVADLTRLLAAGVPANVRDASGFTPLMLAVVNDHVAAARVLLDGGALVNTRNRGGITPAMLAVINEHPEMLALLLDRGADVNAQSGTGWTALTFAAWKGDAALVRVLLAHGANPTALDKQRWTPLDYAAWKARPPAPEGTDAGAAPDPAGGGRSEPGPASAPGADR